MRRRDDHHAPRWPVLVVPYTLLVAALLVPRAAAAQAPQERWSVDGRAGISFATGELDNLPFEDLRPTAGATLTYWLSPRLGLQATGDWEGYLGDEDELSSAVATPGGNAPDLDVFHYGGGVVLEILPGGSPWGSELNVAAGGTTFDSEDFSVSAGPTGSFSQTYPSVSGGVQLGYAFSPSASAFLGGRAHLAFTDEDDTRFLSRLSPGGESFDTAWSFPITAGLKLRF